jgi:uncharacterized protein
VSLTNSVPTTQAVPAARLRSLVTVTVGTVLYLMIVGLVSRGLRWLFPPAHIVATLRSRTTLTISGSALGELAVLAFLILFFRLRGRSLRDLGLWQASPLRGWVLAALMTALYVWVVFMSVLRGQAGTTEISAFHIYNSLAAGLSAGLVEEIFFRGFVMNQLKWCGFGATFQVIASGILFGIAHVGWGLLAAKPQLGAAIGAMLATSILGMFYALIYLGSRRSLMPVIVGHSLMDVLIEPWLIMVTLAGTTGHLHR